MKKNRSVSVFWLSVLAIAVIGYMLLSVQHITRASFVKNEGIEITPSDNVDIIDVDIVNQDNTAWAMKIMCSNVNMRICEYGSQLCCISSIFRKFDIYKNPDTLYDQFSEDELYPEDSSSVLNSITYEIQTYKYKLKYERPEINSSYTFDSSSVIKLLESGTPVMVRTSHPLVSRYWVIITGVKDGEFTIMDPLSDEYGVLSTYSNKVYQIMYFTEND